jgi:hypothetical protein
MQIIAIATIDVTSIIGDDKPILSSLFEACSEIFVAEQRIA